MEEEKYHCQRFRFFFFVLFFIREGLVSAGIDTIQIRLLSKKAFSLCNMIDV